MNNKIRKERGLIIDCMLGPFADEVKCVDPKKCEKCGWNPIEAERRKKECKLHEHASGLRGF